MIKGQFYISLKVATGGTASVDEGRCSDPTRGVIILYPIRNQKLMVFIPYSQSLDKLSSSCEAMK